MRGRRCAAATAASWVELVYKMLAAYPCARRLRL